MTQGQEVTINGPVGGVVGDIIYSEVKLKAVDGGVVSVDSSTPNLNTDPRVTTQTYDLGIKYVNLFDLHIETNNITKVDESRGANGSTTIKTEAISCS